MCEDCIDCICENKTCTQIFRRFFEMSFFILGNVFLCISNTGKESEIYFLVFLCIYMAFFFFFYYCLLCSLSCGCCNCNCCSTYCEKKIYYIMFLLMSSYLIFETAGIILSIVAMVNEEDKGPYKIIDSEYQSFLAFNIVGLICLMIGFIFFIFDYRDIKRKISNFNISDFCDCCCCKETSTKNENKIIIYNNNGNEVKETEANEVNIKNGNNKNNENNREIFTNNVILDSNNKINN